MGGAPIAVVAHRADDERRAVDRDRGAEEIVRGPVARDELLLLVEDAAALDEDVRGASTAVVAARADNDGIAADRDRPAEAVACGPIARGQRLLLDPDPAVSDEDANGALIRNGHIVARGADDQRVPGDRDRHAEEVGGGPVARRRRLLLGPNRRNIHIRRREDKCRAERNDSPMATGVSWQRHRFLRDVAYKEWARGWVMRVAMSSVGGVSDRWAAGSYRVNPESLLRKDPNRGGWFRRARRAARACREMTQASAPAGRPRWRTRPSPPRSPARAGSRPRESPGSRSTARRGSRARMSRSRACRRIAPAPDISPRGQPRESGSPACASRRARGRACPAPRCAPPRDSGRTARD